MNIDRLRVLTKDIRKHILTMGFNAQSAHIGGALSCVEILTVLYFDIMKCHPHDPQWDGRDRLVFSKAHDAKALYGVLCERGYFDRNILSRYEIDDALLAGHTIRGSIPGVETSAGSLGHGLPIACGMAFAGKMKKKHHRIFVLLSDGECDEGSTWEAALFAGHHKLSRLTAIIDYNKLQGFGYTKNVLDLEPFAKKWISFGWAVKEADGHDIKKLYSVLSSIPFEKSKPSVIIAHTIKGKGGVLKHINKISSQYASPTQSEFNEVQKTFVT